MLEFLELDSTNNYSLSLLSKSKPSEGTVILAVNQSAGRGQIGNSWESEPGQNITMSVILYPTFLLARLQFKLNQAISLGVLDFLSAYIDSGLKIKWPNDIYVNNKKIGGTLIQNTLTASKIQSTVVGVGINVNQKHFQSNAPNPTSMFLETSKKNIIEVLIPQLCESIERRYLQLRANNFGLLEIDYLHHLYRLQEDALYMRMDSEEIFSGKIVGVTKTGKLMIDHNKGQSFFSLKEVKFL